MLSDGEETIEDTWCMLFGDKFGSQSGAIDSRLEIYPDCDDDDSEFTVIASKALFVLSN